MHNQYQTRAAADGTFEIIDDAGNVVEGGFADAAAASARLRETEAVRQANEALVKANQLAGKSSPNRVGPRLVAPSTLKLPKGYSNSQYGDLSRWPKGTSDAAAKMRMAQDQLKNIAPELIGKMKNAGVTSAMLKQWAAFYRAEAIRVPQNPTAAARALHLEEPLKIMRG